MTITINWVNVLIFAWWALWIGGGCAYCFRLGIHRGRMLEREEMDRLKGLDDAE